jgi:hypothetical protein
MMALSWMLVLSPTLIALMSPAYAHDACNSEYGRCHTCL